MTKLLKSKKGFTLVEVIVVAVIVLILAAVAIPLYQGYVRDARQNTAHGIAATVAKTIGTAVSVGDYANATAGCEAVTTAQGAAGAIVIGVVADNKGVNWDNTRWNVACDVETREIRVSSAGTHPALDPTPVVVRF